MSKAATDFFKGEWEFLKLFVGLNGASIGGWFVAQDKLVYSRLTAAIFAATIILFAVSMGICLYGIRLLIDLERGPNFIRVETSEGEEIMDSSYGKLIRRFSDKIAFSLGAFGLGYAQAALLILMNLKHKHLP